MTWTQNYIPIHGHLFTSAIIAALPVALLLGLLAFFHVRAHRAALAGLAAVLLIAIAIYNMPVQLALAAAAYGALYGLLPIGWIVLNALFLYDITVETGQFEIMKRSIMRISADRRIQILLIAFCFGAFIEGAAGFGAPVAISAAMLIGIGFRPLSAATLSLIGNTAPVAFGSLGIPIISLAQVTGLPLLDLASAVGRQLPILSLLIPFWLVAVLAGWRGMLGVWPACATAAVSFATVQCLVSNLHGPWLAVPASALMSLGSLLLLLRFWKPSTVWRFADEPTAYSSPLPTAETISPRTVLRAWLPWILLTVAVAIWALPGTKAALNALWQPTFSIPFLDGAVSKAPPLAHEVKAESAVYTLNILSATGTAPLLAGIVAGGLLGLGPKRLLRIYGHTLRRARLSLVTISGMLALAFASRYAGLDATLGLAFASTGVLFPFFSPLLGWLGVALTGSDTASNVLFGNLQQVTARQLGISPLLAAAANSTGGVMGKMIDAQSIVVASVATGQHGQEGQILRSVFWHSIALATLAGLLVLLQAYCLPGIIP